MALFTLAFFIIVAGQTCAKPIARQRMIHRQFSNTSISRINPTRTDNALTTFHPSPTCVITYSAIADETCSAFASNYGIHSSSYDFSSAADSDTYWDVSVSDICVSLASPTTLAVTANTTVATIGPVSNSTLTVTEDPALSADPTSTSATRTTTRTTALSSTLGTGAPETLRTIFVTQVTTETITYSATTTVSYVAIPQSTGSSVCATVAPPATTQAGIVLGCTQWYVAVSGDYCYTVAQRYDISVDTLMAWNPAVEPPNCLNMIAGDAYCVATCGGSSLPVTSITRRTSTISSLKSDSATTISPATSTLVVYSSALTLSGFTTALTSTNTSLLTSTVTSNLPSASSDGVDVYKTYTGDGSVAHGWPSQSQWVDFDYMFDANTPNMKASCAQWGVQDDSEEEVANMKLAIQSVSYSTGVDPRFILATIMQESTGCVRVITTQYSVFNPGLMQSHNGTGTCNTNGAPLGIPGVTGGGVVQNPCPVSEIRQMLQDGTNGTSSGDGLKQCLQKQGHTDVSRFYRAARMYNGGSVDPSGDLGKGCCTLCYASDIANRLTGWVNAPHNCNL